MDHKHHNYCFALVEILGTRHKLCIIFLYISHTAGYLTDTELFGSVSVSGVLY